MHIVIAVITAVAGLFWALTVLRNSGFQFSSLNPFLAIRRWRWSREYGAKPLYKLNRPMDAAGVLLVATAKADGLMSAEQKRELLSMFERYFEISASEASQYSPHRFICCVMNCRLPNKSLTSWNAPRRVSNRIKPRSC